tara:strand:- start:974 stop:3277 length:2304 start_codon:yes stop_codon:yes gene_type:complete
MAGKKDINESPKIKKNNRSRSNKKEKKRKKKKQVESSDDSDIEMVEELTEEEEEQFDNVSFQKMLAKHFPSRYQNEKVKKSEAIEKLKDNVKEKKKKTKKKKKKAQEDEDSSSDYDPKKDKYAEDDEDEDEWLEEDELDEALREEEELMAPNQNMKFNIVFSSRIPGMPGWEEEDEYEDEYEDEWYEEEDDEFEDSYEEDTDNEEKEESDEDSEDEKKKVKKSNKSKKEEKKSKFKKNERVKIKLKDWDTFYEGKIVKVHWNKKPRLTRYDVKLDDKTYELVKKIKSRFIKSIEPVEENYEETLNELKELMKTNKNKGQEEMFKKFESVANKHKKKLEKEKKKREAKKKDKNVTKLRKALREKNVMNDFKYFRNMELESQTKILRQLKEVNKFSNVEMPYRLQLLNSDIPVEFKANAMKKINTLRYMDPGSGEYYKIKQWVDTFMRIPFGKYKTLPVSMADGEEKYQAFMTNAKKILDDAVYGMNDAKMQILQMVGQLISNPSAIGSAIAVKGPPGTGKTTLIKEGVSKILNRPFAFLALGGATDSSFLEGHSYTYEGSSWGKVVDILINAKCMNPLIYFDELDKVSVTPRGEEITGILTHLTDTTQNDKFHDKYFANVDFNLNQAMFIFSYNHEEKVNPILKDRMYRIETAGYKHQDKCVIAQDYLIPKIRKNVNFKEGEIIIPDETIKYLSEAFTESEKGVRNLKRCLEIIHTKLNLYRLMPEGTDLFEKEKTLKVVFPFTVTKEVVDKLIKKQQGNGAPYGMYL